MSASSCLARDTCDHFSFHLSFHPKIVRPETSYARERDFVFHQLDPGRGMRRSSLSEDETMCACRYPALQLKITWRGVKIVKVLAY